jgi:DNA-binding transcriptional MerR regulator
MTEQDAWTLDELIAQVAQALADGYPGAPSGRVRELPDARTVRWYVTRGLVDPPLGMRGRQALYGRRHLLQLVALKRRQSDGAPLAVIQAELAGLPDAALARVAALPTPAPEPMPRPQASPAPPAPTRRARFWAAAPAIAHGTASASASASAPDPAPARPGKVERPATVENPAPAPASQNGAWTVVHRIRLAPGVVLQLDDDVATTVHHLDDAALRAAAAPLLDLLDPLDPLDPHDLLDPLDPLDPLQRNPHDSLQRNRSEDEGTRR